MNQRRSNLALAALLLWLVAAPQCGNGIRLYKSKRDVFTILGAKNETKLFFTDCEQSSQRSTCAFAIDASFVQTPSQCALTVIENNPWWIGILESPAYIISVTLLNIDNPEKLYSDALRGITVSGGGEICFNGHNNEAFNRRSYPCYLITDQVVIESNLPTSTLALCDVEVLGVPLKFPTVRDADELLQVSMCRQMSISSNKWCEMALDKDPGVCAMTNEHPDPTMEFLLERPAVITRVVFYGQPRGSGVDVKKMSIRVGTRACRSAYDNEVAEDGTITIECGLFGNDVVLTTEMNEGRFHRLKVCEVEVYGHPMHLDKLEKYSYTGCYSDNIEDHDLPTWVSSTAMSVKKCYRMCKRKGFKYFAMQMGKHCYCGGSYGKHGEAPGETCNVPCKGNEEEICGGQNTNSVFEITAQMEDAGAAAST